MRWLIGNERDSTVVLPRRTRDVDRGSGNGDRTRATGHGPRTVLGSSATSAAITAPEVLSDSDIVDSIRASDIDRQHTATALGAHMTAGRLTPTEFDDRVTTAYDARTVGTLRELLADLPAEPIQTIAAAGKKRFGKSS